ncbi:MAG: PTS sugar transporter subunit IIA [Gemmatimonadales bacterium]|jgi:mannose/fructose-specific phosphotransferase system component IIA
MSEPLCGVVVAHGSLAEALVRATEAISGVPGVLRAVSNTDCDRGRLETRIAEAIGPGPAVLFVDLPSGSCLFAALHRYHEDPVVKVVTGVNLAMLVDFVFHRELSPAAAAERARDAGTRAIKVP